MRRLGIVLPLLLFLFLRVSTRSFPNIHKVSEDVVSQWTFFSLSAVQGFSLFCQFFVWKTRVRNFVHRCVPKICPLFTFLLNFVATPQLQIMNQLTMIIMPGCEKYVLSVLTPSHLTTCRSGSKASFFPIKVRVLCAQYEHH